MSCTLCWIYGANLALLALRTHRRVIPSNSVPAPPHFACQLCMSVNIKAMCYLGQWPGTVQLSQELSLQQNLNEFSSRQTLLFSY